MGSSMAHRSPPSSCIVPRAAASGSRSGQHVYHVAFDLKLEGGQAADRLFVDGGAGERLAGGVEAGAVAATAQHVFLFLPEEVAAQVGADTGEGHEAIVAPQQDALD